MSIHGPLRATGDTAGLVTLECDSHSGGRAAAGVYLYRMTAGAFREQRHMVLVR